MERIVNAVVTVLHQAAIGGEVKTIALLIKAGADMNAKENKYGFTALYIAAKNGKVDAVAALIKADADVNAKEDNGVFISSLNQQNMLNFWKTCGSSDADITTQYVLVRDPLPTSKCNTEDIKAAIFKTRKEILSTSVLSKHSKKSLRSFLNEASDALHFCCSGVAFQ